jgi:hypothetical protein
LVRHTTGPSAYTETHFVGGLVVWTWAGEGTREIRLRLPASVELCIDLPPRPRVYVVRGVS